MINSIVNEMKKDGFDMSEFEKRYELVTLHQALKSYPIHHFVYSTCLYGYYVRADSKAIIEEINLKLKKAIIFFPITGEAKCVDLSSIHVRIYNDYPL